LQLDAATFLYSHSYALTGEVPAAQLEAAVPAVIPKATVVTSPAPPPETSIADADGIDVLGELTSGGVPNGTVTPYAERFGGASIILPMQIATTGALDLTSFDTSLFTNPIVLTAGNIEGQAMVGNHDDDSTGYAYNSASALSPSDLVSPDTTGGDDQNVPPYYFAMAYMNECNYTSGGAFDCAGGNGGTCDSGTGAGFECLNALGLAEYLKDVSNANATDGNYRITSDGIGTAQLFGAMTLHQQVYAKMAQLLTSAYGTYAEATSASPNDFVLYTFCMDKDWDIQSTQIQSAGNNDLGTQVPQTPLVQITNPQPGSPPTC
jgi:hypothetical protein